MRMKMTKSRSLIKKVRVSGLDFVEGNNVTTLNILVYGFNCEMLFYNGIHRDKVIHNGHHDLQFLYPITNWSQFCCNKSIAQLLTKHSVVKVSIRI